MLLTIFTPTYNRAALLPRLYDSICQQTCSDFEWLIVDDGSTDNTESLIKTFTNSDFPIRYIKKHNGGKHTAINLGIKEAKGELFFIVDSDDLLLPLSIETVIRNYTAIQDNNRFAGICGYMQHSNNYIIGYPFKNIDASSIEMRYKFRIKGDMMEVFKTNILKEFPFPEIPNERFCPEVLIWNRIAQKYKLRIFAKAICCRDYIKGGLTDNIVRIRMQSPVASMMTYSEMLSYDIPLLSKVKAAINYWRFRMCRKNNNIGIPSIPAIWWWTWPLGWLMHTIDTIKVR